MQCSERRTKAFFNPLNQEGRKANNETGKTQKQAKESWGGGGGGEAGAAAAAAAAGGAAAILKER
jgi:hypothetical protein